MGNLGPAHARAAAAAVSQQMTPAVALLMASWAATVPTAAAQDALAAADGAAAAEFFSQNAKRPGVVSLKSQLQYKVIAHGDGEYTPASTAALSVHFEVFELLTKRKVVSTQERGPQPVDMYPESVSSSSENMRGITR